MRFINALVACSVIAITSSSVLAQSTAVQWTVASGGNGHWYGIVIVPSNSWNQCLALARASGGDLASLTSAEEHAFVGELAQSVPQAFVGPYGPFVGGFQDPSASDFSEPSGGWRWSDGEPWGFQAWFSGGEPSNCLGLCGGGCLAENFIQLYGPEYQGTWNDIHDAPDTTCGAQGGWIVKAYVVEYSADCNNDGIVDYGQILSGQLIDANSNGIPDCCENGTACEVNLIQNGGFEFGPVQPDCSWVIHSLGSPFVSGWSVVTASVDRERLSLMCPPALESWMSYEGEYTVDLDGDAAGGAIAQTVQTIPGVPYRLSFELTGNCAPGTKRMSVEIGQVSTQFEHVCTASNPQAWSKKTIDFTAIDLQTTIVMRSLMNDGRNGPVIDDVRLVVHPSDPCPGDISGNGAVDGVDLSVLLGVWGTDGSGGEFDADVTNDGIVNGADLTIILGGWGSCPN